MLYSCACVYMCACACVSVCSNNLCGHHTRPLCVCVCILHTVSPYTLLKRNNIVGPPDCRLQLHLRLSPLSPHSLALHSVPLQLLLSPLSLSLSILSHSTLFYHSCFSCHYLSLHSLRGSGCPETVTGWPRPVACLTTLSLYSFSPLQGSARTGHFRARYRVAKNMRMTKTLRIPPQLACHFWHNNRALLRKMNDFR